MTRQTPTGIEGLDLLLNGGFIENRAILVQGEPGAGKTTFGTQFLVNGILNSNENGLLLAMEYDVADLISDMTQFGWPLDQLINSNRLRIIPPPGGLENITQSTVDDILNLLQHEVSKHDVKRIVIDSVDTMDYLLADVTDKRRELTRFITLLRDLGCTVLLLNEWNSSNNIFEFMTHGVIRLYNQKVGANRLRGLEIVKMRGINHSQLTHSLNIDSKGGIIVQPNEIDFTTT